MRPRPTASSEGPARRILGPAQYAVVVASLVLIPLVVWLSMGNAVHDYYVNAVVAPRLHREFAFQVGMVGKGPDESGPGEWLAVTRVDPGSPLERAGVRRGDTGCLGVDTGGMRDVYHALQELGTHAEVRLSLSNAAQGRLPCRTVTIRRADRIGPVEQPLEVR